MTSGLVIKNINNTKKIKNLSRPGDEILQFLAYKRTTTVTVAKKGLQQKPHHFKTQNGRIFAKFRYNR